MSIRRFLCAILAIAVVAPVVTADITYNKVKVRACTNDFGICTKNCTDYVLNVDECHYFHQAEISLTFKCKARLGATFVAFLGPKCETNYTAQVQQQYCNECSEQTSIQCTDNALLAYHCAGCVNATTGKNCNLLTNCSLGRCTTFHATYEPGTLVSVAMPNAFSTLAELQWSMGGDGVPCSNATQPNWMPAMNDVCDLGFGNTYFLITCEDEGVVASDARLPQLPSNLVSSLVQALKRRGRHQKQLF